MFNDVNKNSFFFLRNEDIKERDMILKLKFSFNERDRIKNKC